MLSFEKTRTKFENFGIFCPPAQRTTRSHPRIGETHRSVSTHPRKSRKDDSIVRNIEAIEKEELDTT